ASCAPAAPPESPRVSWDPALERVLRHERLLTGLALALLCALAWAYLLSGAGMGMSVDETTIFSLFPHKAAVTAPAGPMAPTAGMDMPGMAAEAPAPAFRSWAIAVGMWFSMMIAMMSPAATPVVLLYAQVRRAAVAGGSAVAPTGIFLTGYLTIWLAFSILAA